MIDETVVEERLRRTYADVAARTTSTRYSVPTVAAEPSRSPRPRRRALVVAGIAGGLCVLVAAALAIVRPTPHRPSVVTVSPTTRAPSRPPIPGLTRFTLPGSQTAYVPAFGPIAITPDGRTAYRGSEDGAVTPIDLNTGQARSPIQVGTYPVEAIAITPDGRTAYAVEGGIADVIVPIDLVRATVGPVIPVAGARGLGSSIAITPDGHTAFVSTLSEFEVHPKAPASDTESVPSYVVPVDLDTNTAQRPLSLVPLPGGGHVVHSDPPVCARNCSFNETIGGIAISPDGRTGYVSDTAGQTTAVFPIAIRTMQVGTPIDDGGASGPIVITPDGQTAYVGGLGTITPIDLASSTSFSAIHIPPGVPFSTMAISPDGRTLAGVRYDEIALLDLSSRLALPALPNPNGGSDIAIVPVG